MYVQVLTSWRAINMPAPMVVKTADIDTFAIPRNFSVTILASHNGTNRTHSL